MPNPDTEKEVNYLKYPIYFGGNRGRGQVYPDGSKSNNTVYTVSVAGVIKEINPVEKKGGFPPKYITERCLLARLLQGIRSFRVVGLQVPTMRGDLHSRECSWCRKFQTRGLLLHESPDSRSRKRVG